MKKYSEEAFVIRQTKVNELRKMYVQSESETTKISYAISRLYCFMPKCKKDLYVINAYINRLLDEENIKTINPEFQEQWIKICESLKG